MAPAHPKKALHLLWTIPLACAAGLPFLFYGGVAICGISGCSGGGYGTSYGPNLEWVVPWIIVGVLIACAIMFVPWVRWRYRCAAGLLTGGVVSAALIVWGVSEKYPLVR